jgi:hypothetical protein
MNLTARRSLRACYCAKKGSFAGSIGADQSDRLSLGDLKGHLANGLQQSMPDIQCID